MTAGPPGSAGWARWLVPRLPQLSNSQTTDALHVVGLVTFGGASAIALFTAIWSYFHPTLVAWIPGKEILTLAAICIAGGITNSVFAKDEHP